MAAPKTTRQHAKTQLNKLRLHQREMELVLRKLPADDVGRLSFVDRYLGIQQKLTAAIRLLGDLEKEERIRKHTDEEFERNMHEFMRFNGYVRPQALAPVIFAGLIEQEGTDPRLLTAGAAEKETSTDVRVTDQVLTPEGALTNYADGTTRLVPYSTDADGNEFLDLDPNGELGDDPHVEFSDAHARVEDPRPDPAAPDPGPPGPQPSSPSSGLPHRLPHDEAHADYLPSRPDVQAEVRFPGDPTDAELASRPRAPGGRFSKK